VDAELTVGRRTPLDPLLSTDGIDEVLRVMYGGYPAWATFEGGGSLLVTTTDTGRNWVVTMGRFTGTRPSAAASSTSRRSTSWTTTTFRAAGRARAWPEPRPIWTACCGTGRRSGR
jgi:hypothetical protein